MLKINPFSPGKISFYTNVPLEENLHDPLRKDENK
jgi:hypothetical protein